MPSRLRPVGSDSAISPSSSRKSVEPSPELQRKADEITEKILGKMRDSIRNAVLHALSLQRNESTAEIWLERRILRPAQQVVLNAIKVKKPHLPPPSSRTHQPNTETTGTWKKASVTARRSRTLLPEPQAMKSEGGKETISPLERALARPDRASVPASRRPTPPPPTVHAKDTAPPSTKLRPTPTEEPGVAAFASPENAPQSHSTVTAAASLDRSIPPVSQSANQKAPPVGKKLLGLRYLDSPQEQGSFLIDLILEAAPAESILLHTIDPRSQSATVVAAYPERASKLSGWITSPQDPLLTQLRRLRRPVKITAPSADERSCTGRWAECPPRKYLAAVPVLHDHKLLGFIEVADPLNGNRFTQDQLEAILQLASAWGAQLSPSRDTPDASP